MRSGEGREEGGGRDTERGGDRNAYNKDAYSFRREERERKGERKGEAGRLWKRRTFIVRNRIVPIVSKRILQRIA